MQFLLITIALIAVVAQAFNTVSTRATMRSSFLSMATSDTRGGQLTSPGANMKPMADGTFKAAGEHLKEYILEHDNGSRAVVDTVTATCTSWKLADGTEMVKQGAGTAHYLNGAALKGEFVPEERAKKVSFDRMIFKCAPEGFPEGLEYRIDVTMREDSLEYDIGIINQSSDAIKLNIEVKPALETAKITKTTGMTTDGTTASVEQEFKASRFGQTDFFFHAE